jgi:hypothetical protein
VILIEKLSVFSLYESNHDMTSVRFETQNSKEEQYLSEGAARQEYHDDDIFTGIAGDIVLLPDCGPHQSLNDGVQRKVPSTTSNGTASQRDQEIIQTAGPALVPCTANSVRWAHSGSNLTEDTARAAARLTADRHVAAFAESRLPFPSLRTLQLRHGCH